MRPHGEGGEQRALDEKMPMHTLPRRNGLDVAGAGAVCTENFIRID
jgi:hypothetical protein